MTNPTYDFTRGSAAEATNPLHLIRIDHLQLTGSIEKLEPLYRRLGFARVASQQAPGDVKSIFAKNAWIS